MANEPDSLEERARARVGRVLCEKWRLDGLLGVGGVAAVYAATHRNGRRVAIKVLHPELAVDASIRRRFSREGYVANRVEHPGAVVVLDDAIDADGSVLLVMELLNGETLEGRCRRLGGHMPAAEALRVCYELLDVLGSAHDRGILHRDVTPANVFITTAGQVKLLDFGIARLREPGSESKTMSVPGALGTPAFMAPEQARGLWEQVDARSDLWAVGAVLYRALVGRPVHEGRTSAEVLLAAMTRPAPPLARALPEASDEICELIDRALAFDPEQRFSDAPSFREAMARAYRSSSSGEITDASALDLRAPEPGDSHVDAAPKASFGTFATTELALPLQSRRGAGFILVAMVAAAALVWLVATRGQPMPPVTSQRQEPASAMASTAAFESRRPSASDRGEPTLVSSSLAPTPPALATARALRPSPAAPKAPRQPPASAASARDDDWVLDVRE